jgi:hypothetical protein
MGKDRRRRLIQAEGGEVGAEDGTADWRVADPSNFFFFKKKPWELDSGTARLLRKKVKETCVETALHPQQKNVL